MLTTSSSGPWQSRSPRRSLCMLWGTSLDLSALRLHVKAMGPSTWCVRISTHTPFQSQAKFLYQICLLEQLGGKNSRKLQRGARFWKHTRRKAKGFDGFRPKKKDVRTVLKLMKGFTQGQWEPGDHVFSVCTVWRDGKSQVPTRALLTLTCSGHKAVALPCSRASGWLGIAVLVGRVRKKDEGAKRNLSCTATGSNLSDLAHIHTFCK